MPGCSAGESGGVSPAAAVGLAVTARSGQGVAGVKRRRRVKEKGEALERSC